MEKKVILSKRFQKNTTAIYHYLLKKHSAKTAYQFLDRLQQRIELIRKHSEMGNPSHRKVDVRSCVIHPHNRIYYRAKRNLIELLCIADMRKKSRPY